ncbi:hypothetical protein IMCC3088_613 [Aequoribacter fuscus]|uniref:Uncharacterized protein n=1 Tax=Aequoribacter fuscus TaxID=2518989 RepID=F3L001_9GAMM|nr:hypothetical protein IMCC3088_613 [Aequoribacter fuscus]
MDDSELPARTAAERNKVLVADVLDFGTSKGATEYERRCQ